MTCAARLACATIALATGCGSYQGTAHDLDARELSADRGWLRVGDVAVVEQRSTADCGPAVLAMMLEFWGRPASLDAVAGMVTVTERGTTAAALRDALRARELEAFVIKGDGGDLVHELQRGRPVIVGVVQPHRRFRLSHYEIVVGYHPARQLVATVDPAAGLRVRPRAGFVREWSAAGRVTLIVAGR